MLQESSSETESQVTAVRAELEALLEESKIQAEEARASLSSVREELSKTQQELATLTAEQEKRAKEHKAQVEVNDELLAEKKVVFFIEKCVEMKKKLLGLKRRRPDSGILIRSFHIEFNNWCEFHNWCLA